MTELREITNNKPPHFIENKVLEALEGTQKLEEVNGQSVPLIEGAYLWNVADKEKGKGILRLGALGMTDKEFIEKHNLNSDKSKTRWEEFLLKWQAAGKEEKAKEFVRALIG